MTIRTKLSILKSKFLGRGGNDGRRDPAFSHKVQSAPAPRPTQSSFSDTRVVSSGGNENSFFTPTHTRTYAPVFSGEGGGYGGGGASESFASDSGSSSSGGDSGGGSTD